MHSSVYLPTTGKPIANAKPKLQEQVRQVCRTLHFVFPSAIISRIKHQPADTAQPGGPVMTQHKKVWGFRLMQRVRAT